MTVKTTVVREVLIGMTIAQTRRASLRLETFGLTGNIWAGPPPLVAFAARARCDHRAVNGLVVVSEEVGNLGCEVVVRLRHLHLEAVICVDRKSMPWDTDRLGTGTSCDER
jgi:hypothetical protein